MPTYDYVCQSCEDQFEIVQSMKDDPLLNCPSCKSPSLHRLIGAGAGIIFKGTGFYETDYRRSSEKGESEAPVTKDSSKEGGAGKDTESSSSETKTSNTDSDKSDTKKAAADK